MATHSSVLAWRTPWTEKPSELQSMGSQRVRHDWAANTLSLEGESKLGIGRRPAAPGSLSSPNSDSLAEFHFPLVSPPPWLVWAAPTSWLPGMCYCPYKMMAYARSQISSLVIPWQSWKTMELKKKKGFMKYERKTEIQQRKNKKCKLSHEVMILSHT